MNGSTTVSAPSPGPGRDRDRPGRPVRRVGRQGILGSRILYLLEVLALAVAFVLSLSLGARVVLSPDDVLRHVVFDDGSQAANLLRSVRVPRALAGAGAGAALAVAGALMQAVTRNPLASPGLFGINAGAALAVVTGLIVLPALTVQTTIWLAFAGAAAAGAVVYAISSAGPTGLNPMRITIAGAAIAALCLALTHGLLVLDEQALTQARPWLAGTLSGRTLDQVLPILPFIAVGVLAALGLGRPLNTMSLGDDVARGLGVRVGLIRAIVAVAVVACAGSAVAIAGPILFVGLAVPHLTRFLVGTDYRRVLPHTAILGAALLMSADLVGRIQVGYGSSELPVGVVMGVLGSPVFIYFVRRGVKST